jgi:CheY-like chemotaxis protein
MIATAGIRSHDDDTVLRWRALPTRDGAWQSYVLLIEANQTLRDMFRHALRAANYDVIGVQNDLEALPLIATQAPSVIVIDGALPGLDGHTLLRTLKADPVAKDIPLVVVTSTDRDHVNPDDCVVLLRAPVRSEQLVVAVGYASRATR